MTEWLRRVHYLLTRRRRERELEDEIAFHSEMAGDRRTIGDVVRLREDARDQWGWLWLDRLWQDLRYAARLLRRSPGFTGAAVLMLGVGIGVNVAAFGFFNLIALKQRAENGPSGASDDWHATSLRERSDRPVDYSRSFTMPPGRSGRSFTRRVTQCGKQF